MCFHDTMELFPAPISKRELRKFFNPVKRGPKSNFKSLFSHFLLLILKCQEEVNPKKPGQVYWFSN